jgi:hypothetical protein
MVVISPAVLHAPMPIEPKAAIQPVALPLDPKAANVFDYALPLQPAQKSIADYAPSLKAKLLANPGAMGDRMLQSIESFHKDTLAMRASTTPQPPPAATPGPATASGPAAQHPGKESPEASHWKDISALMEKTAQFNGQMIRSALMTTVVQKGTSGFTDLLKA